MYCHQPAEGFFSAQVKIMNRKCSSFGVNSPEFACQPLSQPLEPAAPGSPRGSLPCSIAPCHFLAAALLSDCIWWRQHKLCVSSHKATNQVTGSPPSLGAPRVPLPSPQHCEFLRTTHAVPRINKGKQLFSFMCISLHSRTVLGCAFLHAMCKAPEILQK